MLPPPHFGEHTLQVLQTYCKASETNLEKFEKAGAIYQKPR
jgi:hypothetical protein